MAYQTDSGNEYGRCAECHRDGQCNYWVAGFRFAETGAVPRGTGKGLSVVTEREET